MILSVFRSIGTQLSVAEAYSACVCQCFSIGGTSEKSFLLTKGEAPNFEAFVNTLLKKIFKNLCKNMR